MVVVLTALAFCLVCSLLMRAPMALLYIVGFPLLLVLGWFALNAISPALAIGAVALGFGISLTRYLDSRRR